MWGWRLVIPALWEAEVGGSQLQTQPCNLARPLPQNKKIKMGQRCSSVQRPQAQSPGPQKRQRGTEFEILIIPFTSCVILRFAFLVCKTEIMSSTPVWCKTLMENRSSCGCVCVCMCMWVCICLCVCVCACVRACCWASNSGPHTH